MRRDRSNNNVSLSFLVPIKRERERETGRTERASLACLTSCCAVVCAKHNFVMDETFYQLVRDSGFCRTACIIEQSIKILTRSIMSL